MNKNMTRRLISLLLFTIMILSSFMPLIEVKAMADAKIAEISEETMVSNENPEAIDGVEEVEEIVKEVEEINTLEEEPPIPEPDKTVKVHVKGVLSGNSMGEETDLPNLSEVEEVEYDKYVTDGNVGIKDVIKLKENGFTKEISSENYIYKRESVVFTYNDGKDDIKVEETKYDDNTSLVNIPGMEEIQYKLFENIEKIEVFYKGNKKPKEKVVSLKVKQIDELHGIDLREDTLNFTFEYTDTEPQITVNKEINSDNTSVEFKLSDGASEKNKPINISNGTIKEIKENSDLDYTIVVEPNKLSEGQAHTIGKSNLKNIHNDETVDFEIIRNLDENNLVKYSVKNKDRVEDITDIIEVEVTNRKSPIPNEYEENKYYYNDELEIKIKDNKYEDFIKGILGEEYQRDSKNEIKIPKFKIQSGNIEINNNEFDAARVQYKVSVNNQEAKTYDVMKKDTKNIEFGGEKIKKVTLNGQDYKGKPIKIEDIGVNIIEISTDSELEEVSYKVKSVKFVNNTTIHKEREFKGLEGTKLTVGPIRVHENEENDYTLRKEFSQNEYYRLSDKKEKTVVLAEGLEVPFNYVEDEVRYKVLYITKYGPNWDTDGEYAIDYEDDHEIKVLHETETFINKSGKPISIKSDDKDFGDNWELIKRDDDIEKKSLFK